MSFSLLPAVRRNHLNCTAIEKQLRVIYLNSWKFNKPVALKRFVIC